MEALIFFAFIAFLVFPALMKGQKTGPKQSKRSKYSNSSRPRDLMQAARESSSYNTTKWDLQKTSSQAEDMREQSARAAKSNETVLTMQTLAARLAENQKKKSQTIQNDTDGSERNRSGISKASFLRGEILDLNRSRRKDWGARHKGDIVNGKSVLVVLGIILIALYILTRLPN